LACLWKLRFFRIGILFACICVAGFAQTSQTDTPIRLPIADGTDLRFAHISFGEGPSHARISDIVEDDQGFLWFGTQDGLRRYDGYRAREYRHDPGNPNSVSGNFIMALFKDRSGKIWVASNEYLDRYDPAMEVFQHYQGASFEGQILNIDQDHQGMIWLATDKGLIRLNPTTGAVTRYQHVAGDTNSLSSDHVSSTFEEKDGTFWVATADSLDIFDRKTGRVTQHVPLQGTFPLQLAGPIHLYEDHSGVLWVILPTGGGLAIVDRRAGKLIHYATTETTSENTLLTGVRSIHEDEDGTLWLGTQSNGLLKIDKQRSRFVRYRNNPTDPDSLSANRVDSLYEDHEGGIWVGTAGGGVNRFARRPLPFQRYRFEHWNRHTPALDTLSTVYVDSRSILWIATIGALERIDRKTGQSTSYRISGGPGQASNTFITSIAEDQSGHLWFGTYGGGLIRHDPRNGQFKVYRHHPADPQSLPNDVVPTVLVDRKGVVWAATLGGVAALDPRTERFRNYQAAGESGTLYRAMAEASDGAIWLGTWDSGVRRLDPASGQFTIYMQDPGRAGSLSSNQVNALCIDHSGTLWVATASGLNRFDPATRNFTIYDERDGLPNGNVNGILEDDNGNLWLSTSNGLSRFDPRVHKFMDYSVSDGLPGNEFYGSNAGFKSRTGEMYFCSRTGLTTFFPESVVNNPYIPPVVLTDFQIFGKPVPVGGNSPLRQSISITNSLTLTHAQNVFSFEFSALSYASPERNRYRYRLEGLEDKWNETGGARRFVTYTTLAPGKYVFRVQGSNNRGVWNEQGIRLAITILPPWWSTWWFRLTAAVLLLALAWSAYYLRVRRVERRNRELTRLYSDLQRSQHNLQQSEGKLAEAQRIAHVGYWDYDADSDRFTWSDETYRIFGLRPKERILNRVLLQELIHPEDRQIVEQAITAALNGVPRFDVEHRLVRPNGEVRYVHVQSQGNVVLDGLGRPHRMFGTVQDITERKRAEEALRQSQEKYRIFFEQNLAGNYISTPEGALLACNSAYLRMFGFASEAEAKQTNLASLYSRLEDREQFLQQVKQQRRLERYEKEFRRKDGKLLHVTENAIGTFSEHGELVEIHGFLMDETQRRRTERQLRQAQKMEAVGQLAGGIAHDFNNILGIINGYSEILLGNPEIQEATRRRLQEVLNAGQRAASLTRQLLTFSRKQVLQTKVLDLNLVLKDIDKMLRRLIGEEIEVQTQLDPDLKPVKADPSQMEQVIVNLCINARDAMPEGGTITIETKNVEVDEMQAAQRFPMKVGRYVRLEVSDNGLGMDKETLSHVFEPFFTTKGPEKGTGLGLATVYGIVKQSDGYVWVYSELGQGTTFSVYLPTALEAVGPREEKAKPAEIRRGRETILLVEDVAALRTMTRELLEGHGYTVLEAEDGERAIQIAREYEGKISLLLTDVSLPKMKGPALAKVLMPQRSGMAVLFMSGYSDNVVTQNEVLKPGTAFLQKPFTVEDLARKVREVLDTQEAVWRS
jgi:PAS domain S-box-containing protein